MEAQEKEEEALKKEAEEKKQKEIIPDQEDSIGVVNMTPKS